MIVTDCRHILIINHNDSTVFRQSSLLQLLPGDDVGGGVLLAAAALVLLPVGLGAGVELAEALSLHFLLSATRGELLLCQREIKIMSRGNYILI